MAVTITSTADKEVTVILANAKKESEIMKGEGDGLRNKIFAEAFGQDPEFFAFYRSMQAYETALRRSFQTPLSKRNDLLGDVTSAIQDIKQSKGFNPLSIFSNQYFTFLRTPTNIAGVALERMPFLGANRILRSYRKQLAAGGAEAELAGMLITR